MTRKPRAALARPKRSGLAVAAAAALLAGFGATNSHAQTANASGIPQQEIAA